MGNSTKQGTRWAPGPAGWMLLCLLVLTLIYLWAVREPPPPWRASYFENERMEGTAVVRQERDVDHHWRREDLSASIPAEHFSVRWDTCLTLEHAQAVAFQLTSEGGSRLFIDRELAIDNWDPDVLPQTRGADVSLEAGEHHLRVEYQQAGESPGVTLVASLDGKRPRRIDPEHLRPPGADEPRPCGP